MFIPSIILPMTTLGESSIVHEEEEPVKVLPVASTPPERYDGMTYDGLIHKERQKRFPVSYYHVQEMNKGPGQWLAFSEGEMQTFCIITK